MTPIERRCRAMGHDPRRRRLGHKPLGSRSFIVRRRTKPMNKCLFPLLALLAASPAAAATLTEVDGLGPNRLALDLAQFSRPVAEACGSGRSVQTNGCSPVDA